MWLQWAWEGFYTGVIQMLKLWWLIPFFVVIQLFKDSGWLGLISRRANPILAPLRLPSDAALPMVAALSVGITFGAGVLLQTAEEGRLNRDDLTIMCAMVGICHAVFEETLLFTSIGTNGLLLISIRALLGFVSALFVSRVLLVRKAAQMSA